ncbi:WAT1-related protein At3g18200-like [Magnolia sinica]|uniref:WAT1-related protein At3g18200-like n=1 Tax=Magnolia sinica TaxID=86752 RepID=UPI00265B38D2|nr:WAT1-related protein At3g18200-like [Magnolia sinica]
MATSSLMRGATKVAPHASMVFVQLITATYFVLSKVILVQGTSSTVFLVYQFIIATIVMGAMAFIFESRNRPPLSKSILGWIFLLAFVGITLTQNLLAACLYYISSTIETAVLNMIPIFTYILSVISRQEELEINTWWGKGKIFGTILSVAGALTLMVWKGSAVGLHTTNSGDWVLGLVMVVAGTLSFSIWILMLRPVARKYPAEFSMISIMLFFATIQQCVVAAIVSHKASEWALKWDLELIDIIFGGALNSGLSNVLFTWCANLKGPIFVSIFSPLTYAFAAILETMFLGYTLHVGSIVGSVMIVVGLYIYLWSKAKEEAYHSIDGGDEAIISSLIISNNSSS